MSRDISELIDDYCEGTYGHTNWAWKSTIDKEELDKIKKGEIEGHGEGEIFFYEEPLPPEFTHKIYIKEINYWSIEVPSEDDCHVESQEDAEEKYETGSLEEFTLNSTVRIFKSVRLDIEGHDPDDPSSLFRENK